MANNSVAFFTTAELIRAKTPSTFVFRSILNLTEFDKQALRVSARSVYGDDLWDFSEELAIHEVRHTRINFNVQMLDGSRMNEPMNLEYLALYKEFVFTLFCDPPPTMPKISTIFSRVGRGALYLIKFMHVNQIRTLSDLTANDIGKFQKWLSQLGNSNCPGKKLSQATLESRAAGLSWLFQQRTKMNEGIRLDPWTDLTMPQWAKKNAEDQNHLGRTIEMPDEVARQLVTAAIKTLLSVDNYLDTRTAYLNTTGSWARRKFKWDAWGFHTYSDWQSHGVNITAACYVLISMFSGMRVNEILAIRLTYSAEDFENTRSCKSIEYLQTGAEIRKFYFIYSKTKKLHPQPVIAKWQVCPIVFDAIDAMTKLADHCRDKSQHLFVTSSKNKNKSLPSISDGTISESLKKFAIANSITDNDEIWIPRTHQFRKKFARMLFRQGLGIRVIQDQLKHFDISMTKLYADANLHHELQSEKFEVSKEIYAELLSSSKPIIGGGTEEFSELRIEFQGKLRQDRNKMLEQLPREALIDSVDFGYCLYKSKRALCGGNKLDCKPAACLNSVIPLETAIRMLHGRKRQNDQLVQYVKSPLAKAHLTVQQQSINDLLDQSKKYEIQTTQQLKNVSGRLK